MSLVMVGSGRKPKVTGTIISPPADPPALKFNVAANSQYLPLLIRNF
jgi:hypothetical protein